MDKAIKKVKSSMDKQMNKLVRMDKVRDRKMDSLEKKKK